MVVELWHTHVHVYPKLYNYKGTLHVRTEINIVISGCNNVLRSYPSIFYT